MRKFALALCLTLAALAGSNLAVDEHLHAASVSVNHCSVSVGYPVYSVRAFTFAQPFVLQTYAAAAYYPTVVTLPPVYNAQLVTFVPQVAVQATSQTQQTTTTTTTTTTNTSPVTRTDQVTVTYATPIYTAAIFGIRRHDHNSQVNVNVNAPLRRDNANVNVAVNNPGRDNDVNVNVNVRQRRGLLGRQVTNVSVRQR